MGGNRSHQALNILVVWFLTGMWHGASWNFIIWGVYFGLIVTIEKYTILRIRAYIPSPLLHLYSLVLVVIGWGIFYFDDSSRMARFFEICFGQGTIIHDYITISALADNCWLWVVCLLFCMPLRSGVGMLLRRHTPKGGLVQESILLTGRVILSIVLLILSVALLVGATNNAFIYTRF
jgi:alginate O-acetyltransferase complex protein AlgI